MDQSVNAILKMIEQNGASLAKKAELCKDSRPDLIMQTEEFYCLYRSLIERYDHLNEELYKNIPLEFQMQDSGSAPNSPMETPNQKNGQQVASLSSDQSLKDGSDSTSSDSESESYNSSGNAYYSLPANTDHKGLYQKIVELGNLPKMEGKLQLDSEDNEDCVFDAQEKPNHGELLGRILSYEEELRDSKLNLKLSEEEIARLKNELEKSEYYMILSETLQGQLESANQSIRIIESDLELERSRTKELKGVAEVVNEMECHLKTAGEEIIMLRSKLESESQKCSDLVERHSLLENDLSERDDEVKALKQALINAEENLLTVNSHSQSTISSLSERNSFSDARIKELELHVESLDGKLRQSEAEKMEVQHSHDTLICELQEEISQLRVELGNKSEHVEILNQQLDSTKFEYDMLEAEKDELSAKVMLVFNNS